LYTVNSRMPWAEASGPDLSGPDGGATGTTQEPIFLKDAVRYCQ